MSWISLPLLLPWRSVNLFIVIKLKQKGIRDGQYYQPNDETVGNAEVVQHHLWLLTLDDKLYTAPLQDPQRVLDVGTGTGLWAIDFADLHPSAEVIGTDLSPIQISSAPPNVTFEIDDCTDEWTYPAESFDYIHVRGLAGCATSWINFYQQALKALKPGGYIEHMEYDAKVFSFTSGPTDPENHGFDTLMDNLIDCGKKHGRRFDIANELASNMQAAGFVDIIDKAHVWPIGLWPKNARLKNIGRWNVRNWEDSMESWCLALFTRDLGWTYEEVQQHIRQVKAAVHNRRLRNYQEVRVIYAKKPGGNPKPS
ncbi:UMTA methyltransferase family protein [Pseudovirgaria hyperparasitica]|uniref:UMTA methyltransferase family protein n=1 Tax=Pseudovirgaria hyperparasitica TaxID=470096 RepID=A0A6A6VZS3_9PEZI|nr:UMTA methyltransferase family protein [Pseudovirgaria hyperparasitica]KAF2755244.1 UMTA methyltransferase family protein [Pseudovirgaria hyperparasitica]